MKRKMKSVVIGGIFIALALSGLTACGAKTGGDISAAPSEVPSVSEVTPAPSEVPAEEATESGDGGESGENGSSLNKLGEGVNVKYTKTSEEAEVLITGCPAYGDKRTPFVYGELVKGDSSDYELICIIIVGQGYYGKKPYNNSPHAFIKSDNTFTVQFSSNDGQGTDWNASNIFLYLVPTGYQDSIEPNVESGYTVAPEQVNKLTDDAVCVIQIDREVVVE